MSRSVQGTIYIAPGSRSCRVYAIPYRMRPGQSPADLLPDYQAEWLLAGELDQKLELRFLAPEFTHLKTDIVGQMGGTFMDAEWSSQT